jgi:hypothetical protein
MFADEYHPETKESSNEESLLEVMQYQEPWTVKVQGDVLEWGCSVRNGMNHSMRKKELESKHEGKTGMEPKHETKE